MCEAVVEGMGGIWDRSERGGNWITACIEAVVAWNAPKPYHPAAVAFVNHSLDHWAGGAGKWHDRFTHHDSREDRAMGTGVVMDRHKKEPRSSGCQTASMTRARCELVMCVREW